MKKKILIVLGGFNFGGTVFSTLNMVSFLKEKYDVYLLPMKPYGPVRAYYKGYNVLTPSSLLKAVSNSPTSMESFYWDKIKLTLFKFINHICIALGINFVDFAFRLESRRIMKKGKYDFVASTQECASTAFVRFFKGAKRIAWFRSEYSVYKNQLTDKEKAKEQMIYRDYDQIVCVSKTTRDDFCKYFEDVQDRIVSIHNIQNVDDIVQKSKETVNDIFNQDCFNIVSVGRIAKQKQFYLIPMIADKLKKDYNLSFKWYIIGDGNVDGEQERLAEALSKYNNRNVVICMGSRLNPYPYIASADLLVNTSYYEACPRVVAEAQILHTPVVCADFSSAREFVKDGENGFVGTIEELPLIISRLIADNNLYKEIRMNCDNYTIDNDSIYKQLEAVFS